MFQRIKAAFSRRVSMAKTAESLASGGTALGDGEDAVTDATCVQYSRDSVAH